MATASDDVTDLQTCPICLEILKIPKNLPCLHTFCEKCIGTYITSLFDRDKNQSTECPVCKSVFVIPEGLCADDWARQLPDNFFLVSLIENTQTWKCKQYEYVMSKIRGGIGSTFCMCGLCGYLV